MKKALWVFLVLVVMAGCTSANFHESLDVNRQQAQYVNNQPPPFFDWSLERHLMTELYTSRNDAVATWSLTWDTFRGKISWECPSIGFPIPGGTQLTNPMSDLRTSDPVPQAEPNGLYSPSTSAGTYVMCLNDDGTVSPVYVEDNVRTFFTPMQESDGKLVPIPGVDPSFKIDPSQK